MRTLVTTASSSAVWLLTVEVLFSGCAVDNAARREERGRDAAPAVEALRQARFEEAAAAAEKVVAADDGNSTAHAVIAIARYRQALHDLSSDVTTIVLSAAAGVMTGQGGINDRYLAFAFNEVDQRLEVVDAHLGKVARDAHFSLDLCLACWAVDWNNSGELDEFDQRLLEVELDSDGEPFPPGDPRRRPTFRFDVADAHWLRAMIGFQRAVMKVVGAYDLSTIGMAIRNRERGEALRIRLKSAENVRRAHALILGALEHAERSRAAILSEKDDEREWLPSPAQNNHPLPYPVDAPLFALWEEVLADLQKLLRSEEGLDVAEIAQLGDHQWSSPPRGYLDVGRMFREPGDLVLEPDHIEALDRDDGTTMERVLKDAFGDKFVPSHRPSGLPSHLLRVKREVARGEDTFERKLRYLLWLN